jgi:hypothetical protein
LPSFQVERWDRVTEREREIERERERDRKN